MKAFALVLLPFILTLPLSAANVVPDPFEPAQITSLTIEKRDGDTLTSIQLAGDVVNYRVTVKGKITDQATAHPAGDDWFQFIQGLNKARVYKWAYKYYYPGQGATWYVDLGMANRQLTSTGTNEYPKEGAEDQPQADPKAGPSIPFQLFWEAALELVGKAPPVASAK